MSIKKGWKEWLAGRKQKAEPPAPAPAAAPAAPPAPAALDPGIVAAIAAVIAIEVKMFQSLQGPRFTFLAGSAPQGWSEVGKLLIRPYQGVR